MEKSITLNYTNIILSQKSQSVNFKDLKSILIKLCIWINEKTAQYLCVYSTCFACGIYSQNIYSENSFEQVNILVNLISKNNKKSIEENKGVIKLIINM